MKQPSESSAFEEPTSDNLPLIYLPSPHLTVAEIARDCIDLLLGKKGFNRGLKTIKAKYGLGVNHSKRNGTDCIFYWSNPGFSKWVLNPVLDGHTCYGRDKRVGKKRVVQPREKWTIIPDTHSDQRLLKDGESDELIALQECNMRLAGGAFSQNSLEAEAGSNYSPYAYQSGMVYCAECSSRCTKKGVAGGKHQYRYTVCRHSGHGCNNRKSVRQSDIEEALINALVERSTQLGKDAEIPSTAPVPVKSQRQIELEERLTYLETMPGFDADVEDLKEKLRQQLREEMNPFVADTVADKTAEELIRAGNNLGIWQNLTNDEKIQIYPRIVSKIYIRHGRVESIVFKTGEMNGGAL